MSRFRMSVPSISRSFRRTVIRNLPPPHLQKWFAIISILETVSCWDITSRRGTKFSRQSKTPHIGGNAWMNAASLGVTTVNPAPTVKYTASLSSQRSIPTFAVLLRAVSCVQFSVALDGCG